MAVWFVPTLPAVREAAAVPAAGYWKSRKAGGMSGRRGNQVKGRKGVTGHSLSHCRRPSLCWSRPAGRSTPSSDPPGSAGSASASRGRQRGETGERSETEHPKIIPATKLNLFCK